MNRSTPSKIDPEMLGELNYEQQFTQSISSTKRQVKIEKGKAWRIRYLPAKLGPKKTFFARVAKHWLATKPITCPRHTSPAFGGDPDAYCPNCDLSNQLNDSANQAEAQLGFDVRSSPQWLVYGIVFEKDGMEQPMSEVLVPYEHWMYKGTWEELKAFYMAGGQKSPLSVLDYKLGNDFVVSRTGKGFKLDKQDSMPIFDPAEPKYADWIKKIEEQLKNPRVQMPTQDEMEAFALKIEEQLNKLRGVSTGARRGRPSTGLEENDDPDPQSAEHVDEPEPPRRAPARGATAAATATRRPAPQPDPEPEAEQPAAEDDDQIPGAEVPAKPAARAAARPAAAPAAAPARAAARPAAAAASARRPAPKVEPEPEPEAEQPDPEAEAQPDPEAETEQPEAEEPEPAPAPRAQAGRAAARPAAAAAARRPAPAPAEEAEDDNLPPDETADQAPPAPMEDEEAAPAAAPPPVTRKGALGSAIKDKINAVKNRGL